MTSRRAFIQQAGVGLAASGMAAMGTAAATSRSATARGRSDWIAPAFGPKPVARGSKGMVICSNPAATRAGIDILKAGGNAMDAALCTSTRSP